jgi:hypothetical protein
MHEIEVTTVSPEEASYGVAELPGWAASSSRTRASTVGIPCIE